MLNLLICLRFIVIVAYHRQLGKYSTQMMQYGPTPIKPLEFPFKELCDSGSTKTSNIKYYFTFEWWYFLGVTEEKRLKMIFRWNILIEEFSSLLRNQIVIPKLCPMYPKHSTAFTKRRPLVIISLKKIKSSPTRFKASLILLFL